MSLINALGASLSLIDDAQSLGKSVKAALSDPAVKTETASHPAVKGEIDMLSADWRTVENDVTGVKKSNILSFFGRVQVLLVAADKLKKDVAGAQHDSALAQALMTMPATLAALSKVSEQWVKVEADLKGLR